MGAHNESRTGRKASTLIERLQSAVRKYGDLEVEIETDHEIVSARRVRHEETDAPRGNTVIIQGS